MTVETTGTPAASTTPAATGAGTTPAPAGAATQPVTGTTPATATTTPAATPPTKGSFLSGAPKAEQGKPVEGNTTTPPAGSALEVKIPEGFKADPKVLETFTAKAAELKLNSEQANAMLAIHAETTKAAVEAQVAEAEKTSATWESELNADKDFGGQNLQASKRAIELASTMMPEAKAAMADLEKYGFGNLPSAVKLFSKIGSMFAEDKTSAPKTPPGSPVKPLTSEEKWARVLDGKGGNPA